MRVVRARFPEADIANGPWHVLDEDAYKVGITKTTCGVVMNEGHNAQISRTAPLRLNRRDTWTCGRDGCTEHFPKLPVP